MFGLQGGGGGGGVSFKLDFGARHSEGQPGCLGPVPDQCGQLVRS